MSTLTLKNVPSELHRRLKEQADRHRRSLNSEALACLEQAAYSTRADVEALLDEARILRAMVREKTTDGWLSSAKKAGRP